jgi:hypothetical protein
MACTTCGAHVPEGRTRCETCGAFTGSSSEPPSRQLGPGGGLLHGLQRCMACGYTGQGLSYFSRGSHKALLVVATGVTMPFFGAGGLIYYLVCRDHRVCPRCGRNWGRLGERASTDLVASTLGSVRPVDPPGELVPRDGGGFQGSVFLGVLAVILLVIGIAEAEAALILPALAAAAASYFLRRRALSAREERRAALLSALQLPVLRLAAQRGGRLTVTEAAAALGWTIPRAEKVLQSLDDGWRVDSEVTGEGVIVYLFRELGPSVGGGEQPRELPPEFRRD